MTIVDIIVAIGFTGLVSTMAVLVAAQRQRSKEDRAHFVARQAHVLIEAMTVDRARRHGYPIDPVGGERREPAILNPGAQEPPPDQRAELREWRAAWIERNEEFILETDRILNDIAWANLGSAAQDAGGANDRWEQAS